MSTVPQQPATNFIQHLGVDVTRMADGEAELWLDIQPHHLNSARVLHGGVLSSLADTVAGAAAFSALEKGQRVVTTDMHLTCMGNVGSGRVSARASLAHRGRRFIRADVRIEAGDRLLASGGISFMVVEAVPAG